MKEKIKMEKIMKIMGLMVLVSLVAMSAQMAFGEETVGEKINVTANNSKRAVKKGAHRLSEALCAEGDVKCAGKKVKNSAVEAKDATVDGAKNIKNKID